MKKSNAMRILEQEGIAYEAYEYDGEGGKIPGQEIAARIGKPAHLVCKTLVTCTDRREYFVFTIPVEKTLDLKKAAKAAGVKALAMLPLAKLFTLTGYVHGGCSPLGLKTSMPVFIDASLDGQEAMFLSGGRIGLNIKVSPADLARVAQARFADVTT